MFDSNRTQVKSQSFVLFPGVGENGYQRMPPASIYGELSTLACSRSHMRFLPCRYFITALGLVQLTQSREQIRLRLQWHYPRGDLRYTRERAATITAGLGGEGREERRVR